MFATGSVALLADTIHNVADATTAIPLWIAFKLAQRKPTATFTYGYGRVEDLAGIAIVLVILFSALVAGYQSTTRLFHPEPIAFLGWVALAGIVGFSGNELVAVFRIRVGREINSAALIADGYHARTDSLTSLAVVAGALGVWLGFPLADPIIGLLITLAIFGIGKDYKLSSTFRSRVETTGGTLLSSATPAQVIERREKAIEGVADGGTSAPAHPKTAAEAQAALDVKVACHRQCKTDPGGNMNLTHRIRWFLLSGGADAEGGGTDGIGYFEETRREYPVADAINGAITEHGSALFAGR